MIYLDLMRLYTQKVPKIAVDSKNTYCFLYFSDNTSFLEAFSSLSIEKRFCRRFVMFKKIVTKYGIVSYPVEDKKSIAGLGLVPTMDVVPSGENFFVDGNEYIQKIFSSKKLFDKPQMGMANRIFMDVYTSIVEKINKLVKDKPVKIVLIYNYDKEKTVTDAKLRPIWNIYLHLKTLYVRDELPAFSYFLLHEKSGNSGKFRLLVKDRLFELKRFMSAVRGTKQKDLDEFEKFVYNSVDAKLAGLKSTGAVSEEAKERANDNIEMFLKNDLKKEDKEELKTNFEKSGDVGVLVGSVLSKAGKSIRDEGLSDSDERTPAKKKRDIATAGVKDFLSVVEEAPKDMTSNALLKSYDFDKTYGKISTKLTSIRIHDFEKNFLMDTFSFIKSYFSSGMYYLLPLDMDVEIADDPYTEVVNNNLLRIKIKMLDDSGNIKNLEFEIPRLMNNEFKLYGKDYIITNQLISFPVTFPEPHVCKIKTNTGKITVTYKAGRTHPYYECYIGKYKVPISLIFLIEQKLGLTFDRFGIKYTQTRGEGGVSIKTPIWSGYLQNESDPTIAGIVKSFEMISKKVGRTSSVAEACYEYTKNIDSYKFFHRILASIITKKDVSILKTKNYPSKIFELFTFICKKISDPNHFVSPQSLSENRIRSSEVIFDILSKEFVTAYTKYQMARKINAAASFDIDKHAVLQAYITSQNVQLMENICPYEYLSVLSRISPMGVNSVGDSRAISIAWRATHDSHFGLIDPNDTPEGGNVGVLQQLSISADIQEGTNTFNLKEINDKEQFGVLSYLSSLLPFVNCDDPGRVMLACSQLKSVLPIYDAETPSVVTGFEGLLTGFLDDKYIKKAACGGVVQSIKKDQMSIKCKTGNIQNINLEGVKYRSGQGFFAYSDFEVLVKEGQAVNKGQVVAKSDCITPDLLIGSGRNLLCVFMPYGGYNYEDGIVLSEGVGYRSRLVDEINYEISEGDIIKYIAKEGTQVERGDVIVEFIPGKVSEFIKYSDDGYDLKDGIVKMYSKHTGVVKKVEYKVTDAAFKKFDAIRVDIENYYKKLGKEIPRRITSNKIPMEYGVINIDVVYENVIGVGDKMCNRHGNKGVVATVLPEEMMPQTPFGPAQIALNTVGVIGRMNLGQIYELYVGLIAKELYNRAIVEKEEGFKKTLQRTFEILFSKSKESVSKYLEKINKLGVRGMVQAMEKSGGFFPIGITHFKNPSHSDILGALKYLGLKEKYKVKVPIYGGVETMDPVAIGYMYMYQLEHLSENKMNARSTKTYIGTTKQPQKGRRVGGGQRFGEFDSWAITSYDANFVLDEMYGLLSDDHTAKNIAIQNIIETGKTDIVSSPEKHTSNYLNSLLLGINIDVPLLKR